MQLVAERSQSDRRKPTRVSRAQRSMSEANGALQTPISSLPEIGILSAQSRVSRLCVDAAWLPHTGKRKKKPGSRISGAPLRATRSTLHRIRDTRTAIRVPTKVAG